MFLSGVSNTMLIQCHVQNGPGDALYFSLEIKIVKVVSCNSISLNKLVVNSPVCFFIDILATETKEHLIVPLDIQRVSNVAL
jgi:hypothetical protein